MATSNTEFSLLDKLEAWQLGFSVWGVILIHLHAGSLDDNHVDAVAEDELHPVDWPGLHGLDKSAGIWKDTSSDTEYSFGTAGRAALGKAICQLTL